MKNALKTHAETFFNEGMHFDGRALDQYRDLSIEYGVSKNAEGSAKITLGDTVVLAGVKTEVGTPYPDQPDQGSIMVNVELVPLASPKFESGPPSIDAIELARVVDRGIRESKAIDFKKLCIREGEKSWTVIIDIVPVNDGGNLFDASALAALAALKVAKFPKLEENDVINYKELTKEGMPLTSTPVSVTVYLVGDKFLIDPSAEEIDFVDARLTVASIEDGTLVAMQKGGETPLSIEQINQMVELAVKKAQELRGKL